MNKPSLSLSNGAALLALLLTVSTPPALADSLWQDGNSRPMVGDKRAVAIGDILSIVVQENSTATKDNNTKTSKKSSVDASLNTILYSPAASKFLTKKGELPALKFDAKQDFDGGGKINNSEKMIARIAVRVVDVLPNQNLVIEGRRQTAFASETQDIILRGIVRPADITAGNTVFSYNVADATIRIVSKGAITDNQRKGWFTRVWEKVTPF
ncbi:MAG TPA: flagellar basal body L-ring protein FlgH [Verrucomicrobiae bacterium]|jgi:flagellar L-ring protein precursor FlgH